LARKNPWVAMWRMLSLLECGFGGVGGGEDGGARKQRGNGQYLGGGAGKRRDLELTEVGGSFPTALTMTMRHSS